MHHLIEHINQDIKGDKAMIRTQLALQLSYIFNLTKKTIHVCKLSAGDKYMELTEASEFQVTCVCYVYTQLLNALNL